MRTGLVKPKFRMLSAKMAICFGGCRLALRGLGRIASMAMLSVLAPFIRAKTRAASSGVSPAVLPDFFALAPLVPPDCTLTSTSSSPKAVDVLRERKTATAGLNRLLVWPSWRWTSRLTGDLRRSLEPAIRFSRPSSRAGNRGYVTFVIHFYQAHRRQAIRNFSHCARPSPAGMEKP